MRTHGFRILAVLALTALIPACTCDEDVFIVEGGATGTGGGGVGGGFVPPDVPDVVFMADRNMLGTQEVFAANLAGTVIVNLSGASSGVDSFKWSPDRSRVAFTAFKDSSSRLDLYVVSAVGGAALRVSGGVNAVREFAWAPNSGRIAFVEGESDPARELYTALAAGGGYVRVASATSTWFSWAPDSSRLAFTRDGGLGARLYTTLPTTSAGEVELTAPFSGTGGIVGYSWAPTSARLALTGRAADTDPLELWTSTPDGSDLDKVSGVLTAGGDVSQSSWAPDGSAICYLADQEEDEVRELYVSPPDTAVGNVRVSADLTGSQDVDSRTIAWAPNSSRIAYVADQDTEGVLELYTTTPDGLTNVKVSGAMTPGGEVQTTSLSVPFRWAPNSSMIVYRADQDTDDVFELYQCPPDAPGLSSKRSDALVPGGDVSVFNIAPLSDSVAYVADQAVDGEFQLYVANLGSLPLPRLVSGVLVSNGDVASFGWTASSLALVYTADQETDGTVELFAAGAGGGWFNKISGLPLLGQYVSTYDVR